MSKYAISRETFLKAQAGDVAARNEIIEVCRGLVASIARRVTRHMTFNRGHAIEDRFQDGIVYMEKIIENFDVSLGTPFVTYAARGLSCHMMQKLYEDKLILVTRNQGLTHRTRIYREAAEKPMVSIRSGRAKYDGRCIYRHGTDDAPRRLADVTEALGTMNGRLGVAVSKRMRGETFKGIGHSFRCSHVTAMNLVKRGVLQLQSVLKSE